MINQTLILIVEDDDGLNRLMQLQLQKSGYRTEGVSGGAEAIASLEKHADILMLLDLHLRDMSGKDVLRLLGEHVRKVPFIVMTGHGDEKTAVEMMKAGALDYVVKNTDFIETLPHLVDQVIAKLLSDKELVQSQEKLIAANLQLSAMNRQLAAGEQQLHATIRQLTASESRYRGLFECSSDAIMILEPPSWAFTSGNPSTIEMFRAKSAQDFLSRTPGDLSPQQQPDGRDSAGKAGEMIETAMRDGSHFFEWTHKRIDGEEFPATVLLTRIAQAEKQFLLATVRDISKQQQADEMQEKLERQLRQSQKMEAIGQIAAGVAHDFNNALGGIMGYTELLRVHLESSPKLKNYTERIASSVKKAAGLTCQLLAFARKGDIDLVALNMDALVQDTVELLRKTLDRRITITTDLHALASAVIGDRDQLANALLNLGINAQDAMPDGGSLVFSSAIVTLSQDSFVRHGFNSVAGEYVELRITDTGKGMQNEILTHVFEPFFTTREIGRGTGLGLASVYGTIKRHKGYILIASPEHGTEFSLYLPIVTTEIISRQATEESLPVVGTGNVLLIDDEDQIRGKMEKKEIE